MNFGSMLGLTTQTNNPTQSCIFERYTQTLPRTFGPSGKLKDLSEKQLDDLLKVLHLCNTFEKHDTVPSSEGIKDEKQKKIYLIEQYYKNPDKKDVNFLFEDFNKNVDTPGSPIHDTQRQNMFKTKEDFLASKKAHEVHNHATNLFFQDDMHAIRTKQLDIVLKETSEALKLSPNCIEAYNILAMYKSNNYEEALAYYRQGQAKKNEYYHSSNMKTNQKDNWTQHELRQYFRSIIGEANILRKMGKYQEALDAYNRAKKLDPELHGMMVSYCNFQANIPECLMKLGKWKEAYDFMKQTKDLLSLGSSKVLLWSFALCDYILKKKTPNDNSVEDHVQFMEKDTGRGMSELYGPIAMATINSPLVYEYLLGIRKLANCRIPKGISFNANESSIVSQAQYISDHLDLWLSHPDALEWAIKNANIVNAHMTLSNEEKKLERKHMDTLNPFRNFFNLYSKLIFPGARSVPHMTLLHTAVKSDNVEAVRLLIDQGAPILTREEPTPFHLACYYDHSVEIVKLFCEKTNAPLKAGRKVPQSPLTMALNQGNWKPVVEILSYLLKKKALKNDDLLSGLEVIFSTSVYECVKGIEECQRCCMSNDPHSKDLSFEKCIDALFIFGLKVPKHLINNMRSNAGAKGPLVRYTEARMDGSVSILPRSLNITDQEVVDLLANLKNTPSSSSTKPSTSNNSPNKTNSNNNTTPTETPEELKNKGNEEFKKGACMKALDFYNKALKHPDCPENLKPILHSNMSACFFNLKHYERALSCADDAITCDSNFIKGHYRKAMSLEALERIKEAIQVCKSALEKDPDNELLINLFKKLKQQDTSQTKEETSPTDFNPFEKIKDMMTEGLPFMEMMENIKNNMPSDDLAGNHIAQMVDTMVDGGLAIIEQKFAPHKKEIYSYLRKFNDDQRVKIWESCRDKLPMEGDESGWFKEEIKKLVCGETFIEMMDALIYIGNEKIKISSFTNPHSLLKLFQHIPKVEPLFVLVHKAKEVNSTGIICLLNTVSFLLGFSGELTKRWEKSTLHSINKERKRDDPPEIATIHTAKKKKHCPMCPRIDDEKFNLIPLAIEVDHQLNIIKNYSKRSLSEKKEALIYISKCENKVFELITDSTMFDSLKNLLKESPDTAFDVLGNIFAVAHIKQEYIEKALNCVEILEKDLDCLQAILSFGSTAKSLLSSSLCRFIANGAFVSDKLGCLMEPLLPALYHTISSSFSIDEEKLPDVNALRAVASLSTIPNLRVALHCLGFAHILYQIQIHPATSRIDPVKAGMSATAKDWMSSGDKPRISFTSQFDPIKQISSEERKSMFAATAKFSLTNELPPIQPLLKEKIKQQGLTKALASKFICTVADGYGILRIVRVDTIDKDLVATALLINVYTQVVRDTMYTTFSNTKQCDNFLKQYLGSTKQFRPYKSKFIDEQQFTSFSVLPDSTGIDITDAAVSETLKIRPLNEEEEEIIQLWRTIYGKPNLGKKKSNGRTVYEVLWANISDLKQPLKQPFTFRFYREMFCTPFFHNYYFAAAEKIDFGFMTSFETISNLNIHSIHDMVPLPTEKVADWIICMCDILDHVAEAKKFLVNIFTYSAYYFKCYGNPEIAADIFQNLKKWREGSIKAIHLPFIRAFIERTLYFDGQEALPDGMVLKLFETYGLEHAINTCLENSRSRLPARLVPRNEVFLEISKGLTKWCMARKSKGKKSPNINTLFEKVIPLIAKHPEIGDFVASLLISMSNHKLIPFLATVWKEISAEKLDVSTPQDIFEVDAIRMSFVQKEQEARQAKRVTTPKIAEVEKEPSLPSAIASVGINEIKPSKEKTKSKQPAETCTSTHETKLPEPLAQKKEQVIEKQPEATVPQKIETQPTTIPTNLTTTTPSSENSELKSDATSTTSEKKSYECACCGKPNSKKKCGACQAVVYCSKECQAKHWKVHKPLCVKK